MIGTNGTELLVEWARMRDSKDRAKYDDWFCMCSQCSCYVRELAFEGMGARQVARKEKDRWRGLRMRSRGYGAKEHA